MQNFGDSNLSLSKGMEEKPLGGQLDALVKKGLILLPADLKTTNTENVDPTHLSFSIYI